MEHITKLISENLKSIRKEKGYSLDKVSELTGVSKGMLGQIERGESNPTVTTLWKIANGLKVSFSNFIEEKEEDITFISKSEINPITEYEGNMKLYTLFPYEEKRRFEVLTIELAAGCEHKSSPHNDGVEEYIIMTEGEMEMVVGDTKHYLRKGDALRYKANTAHVYRNHSAKEAVFQNIIYYM